MFRRAAINAAYGSAKSFFSSLKNYKDKKAKVEARGKKYKQRPPVPPREWNKNTVFYTGMIKSMDDDTVMLKLYTGKSWVWLKFRHTGRTFPDGWNVCSPQAIIYKNRLELHFPVEKNIKLIKIAKQLRQNPDLKVCAVDLNMDSNHAVCVILSSDGTQGKVKFIHGNKPLQARRKRLLGKIAVKRSQYNGILEEDDNIALWKKIRDIEDYESHRVSRRIVEFAIENNAAVIVFENLKNLKPAKGKYSKRSNTKRAYWLKGKIQNFTRYKALEHNILISLVSPRNTSRNCYYCVEQVFRYNDTPTGHTVGAPLFLCPNGHKGNADVNASWNIGKKFFLKHSKPGKKLPGVTVLQAANQAIEQPEHSNGPVALPDSSVGQYGPNEVAATPQMLRDTPTHGLA
jgi:IS605 OrfB family transposase